MNTPPPMPASAGDRPPGKKGLPPLAWWGIGCGGLLLVAIVGLSFVVGWAWRKFDAVNREMRENPSKAAAEAVVRMNPDHVQVSEDDEAGEMTIRNVKTGETKTLDYDDLARGRFEPETRVEAGGAPDLSQLPAWVPAYPKMTTVDSFYFQGSGPDSQGVLVFTTADSPEDVGAFYTTAMGSTTAQGSGSLNVNGATQVTRSFSDPGIDLEVTAKQSATGAATRVQVEFTGSKP